MRRTISGTLLTIALTGLTAYADWPMYGGNGSYTVSLQGLELIDAPKEIRVLWKTDIHTGFGKGGDKIVKELADDSIEAFYGGISSLVVAADVLVCAYFRPSGDVFNQKASNRYNKLPAESGLAQALKNRIDADDVVVALDARTGKILWKVVEAGRGMNMLPGKRGHFGHSPVIAEDRVVTLGSTGRVYCYQLKTGKKLWETTNGAWHDRSEEFKKQALAEKQMVDLYGSGPVNSHFTYRQSDLVAVGQTVVVPDNHEGLLGLCLIDGNRLWHSKGCLDKMVTPALVQLEGKSYLLANKQNHVCLIDPDSGEELWTIDSGGPTTQSLAPNEGHVILNTRGEKFKGSTDEQEAGLWGCFRLTPAGAIKVWTMPFEDRYWAHWRPDRGSDRACVIHNGRAYVKVGREKNERRFCVVDLKSGKILDEQPAVANGAAPTILENLLVYDEDTSHSDAGNLIFLRITSAGLEALGQFVAQHRGVTGYRTSMQFAYSNGRIYGRGHRCVICYDLRARK